MLPKRHRLNSKRILEVIQKGKRINSQLFNLVILHEPGLRTAQFAFVVSKKIAKKAVHRNRTKRLLSEAVFHCLPRIKKGFQIIIFAKKDLKEKKLEDLLPEMKKSFRRLQLFK